MQLQNIVIVSKNLISASDHEIKKNNYFSWNEASKSCRILKASLPHFYKEEDLEKFSAFFKLNFLIPPVFVLYIGLREVQLLYGLLFCVSHTGKNMCIFLIYSIKTLGIGRSREQ